MAYKPEDSEREYHQEDGSLGRRFTDSFTYEIKDHSNVHRDCLDHRNTDAKLQI